MVVAVLITNCHVSEKPNSGPDSSHAMTIATAIKNAHEVPTTWDTQAAYR